MWVDESAGEDPTGNTTGTDDMTITVEGHEYSAEVNTDIDDDGVADAAVIERSDGSTQAFYDEDGDGEADSYVKLDPTGEVVAQASYDEHSGDWVSGGHGGGVGDSSESGDTRTSSGGMSADMPSGDVAVGRPTVDTNDDGVADTAVVTDDEGNTMMFTDVDGDGAADVVVVVAPDGDSTTYEHTGDGEWTPVGGSADGDTQLSGESGDAGARSGPDGSASTEPDSVSGVAERWGVASGWGGADSQQVSGVAHINPMTGQWISPN